MDYDQLINETRQQAEDIRNDGLYDYKAKDIAEDFLHLANVIEKLRKEITAK